MKNVLLIYADKLKLLLSVCKHFLAPKSIRKIKFYPKIGNFLIIYRMSHHFSALQHVCRFPCVLFSKIAFLYEILFFTDSHDCEDTFKYVHHEETMLRKYSVTILKRFILTLFEDIISLHS